jgi:hypothetical protein
MPAHNHIRKRNLLRTLLNLVRRGYVHIKQQSHNQTP